MVRGSSRGGRGNSRGGRGNSRGSSRGGRGNSRGSSRGGRGSFSGNSRGISRGSFSGGGRGSRGFSRGGRGESRGNRGASRGFDRPQITKSRSSFYSREDNNQNDSTNGKNKYVDSRYEKPAKNDHKLVRHTQPSPPPVEDESESSESEDEDRLPKLDPYTRLMNTFSTPAHDAEEDSGSEEESSEEEGGSEEEEEEEGGSDEENKIDEEGDESDDEENINNGEDEEENDSLEESESEEDLVILNGGKKLSSKKKLKMKQEMMSSLQADLAAQESDLVPSTGDPFSTHFELSLSPHAAEAVRDRNSWTNQGAVWPHIGRVRHSRPVVDKDVRPAKKARLLLDEEPGEEPLIGPELRIPTIGTFSLDDCHIKQAVQSNVGDLDPLQQELLSIMSNYTDLYYPEASYEKWDDVTKVYCIHALNHILKTRARIIGNNHKLNKAKLANKTLDTEQFRDQGFARPKVLVLLPSRHSAYRVVKCLSGLLNLTGGQHVLNWARFESDYGPGDGPTATQRKKSRPADFKAIFTGDTNDDFKIGITLTRKSMKVFTSFHSSDIILASPLGMRLATGVNTDEEGDKGFLTSIEMLVMDQADMFVMQNWEHLTTVMENINLPFSKLSDITSDKSRVRDWMLAGLGRLYRQTIVFSSTTLVQHMAAFDTTRNLAGKVQAYNPPTSEGTVSQVVCQDTELTMARVPGNVDADVRFKFFTEELLPRHTTAQNSHTLLYVPDYCDYLRLHLYLSAERCLDFSSINEFMVEKSSQVASARSDFFGGKTQLLLYTERYHFYKRPTIKGVTNIIFYELPTYPHYFPEICNFMTKQHQNPSIPSSDHSVTVLYQRGDIYKMRAVMGVDSTREIMASAKAVHMCPIGS